MATDAVIFRVMPTSPEVDMVKLAEDVKKTIIKIGGSFHKMEEKPIAFGLKALIFIIAWPEEKDPDVIESEISKIKNVNSIEITDVRRAIG